MLGIEGWRCAFHLVALVSIVTSVLTMWLAADPRKKLAVRAPPRHPVTPDVTSPLLICPQEHDSGGEVGSEHLSGDQRPH